MNEIQKYFTSKAYGGYSDCTTNLDHKWWTGSTISNCVGLAWGLFNLDRGRGRNFRRIRGDAKDIYPAAYKNGSGFMTGTTPCSSSIACYNNGGEGHVVYILWAFESDRCVGIESNLSGTTANRLLLRVKIGDPRKWYKGYQGVIKDYC